MTEWKMPTFDGLCGHKELGEALISWREWFAEAAKRNGTTEATKSLASITSGNIEKLMELAYFASCIPDEERFPHFTLFVRSYAEIGDVFEFTRFDNPLLLQEPGQLAEFAMTLPDAGDWAIHVEEKDEKLYAVGFVNLAKYVLLPGKETAYGLKVIVHGPGRLRVQEINQDMQIWGGVLRSNRSIYNVQEELSHDWLEQLRKSSLKNCQRRCPNIDEKQHTYAWNTVVSPIWTTAIITAIRQGHGGAIIILRDPNTDIVDIKHRVSPLSFFGEINKYLLLRCSPSAEPDREPKKVTLIETYRRRLFDIAHFIGNLTTVDGCVVMNRKLELNGYGGKIQAEKDAKNSDRSFQPRENQETQSEEHIMSRFGTRHRSAYYLCKAIPSTIAYVISQDKELRIFWSDKKNVFLEEYINPHIE